MTQSPADHDPKDDSPTRAMPDWSWPIPKMLLLALAGLLIMVPPMTVDMLLPNLNAIADDFDQRPAAVRQVVPFFFIGLGLGHFLWGPISDRYGRRPALIGGLLVYGAASLLAAFAPNLTSLLALRVLQGFGGASGFLLGRAILRDCFQGRALGWAISVSSSFFAAAPVVAPLLGWSVGGAFGWRATLYVTTGYCLLTLLLVIFVLPETRLKSRPLTANYLIGGVAKILAHRQSRHYLLVATLVAATLPLMLSNLPNLYLNQLGVSRLALTLILSVSGSVIVLGQVMNARVISRFGSVRACVLGAALSFACTAIFGALTAAGLFGLIMLIALTQVFFALYLVIYTNATALVLDPHGDQIGLTAAFFGVATTTGGSCMAALANSLSSGGAAGFALALVGLSLAVLLSAAWPLVRGDRRG